MSLKKLKQNTGFTLIELMIVVAIIGILAAVAIPKFADLVTRSKEASVKGSMGAVRSAVSIYYSDTEGEFPTNLFQGLTLGNKYMPSVGGTRALGRFAVPKVTSQSNPGHHNAAGFNLLDVETEVLEANGLLANDAAASGIVYSTAMSQAGELAVNCTHNDTKGTRWTTY